MLLLLLLLVVFLSPAAFPSLHPECEYIFQLRRDEQRCRTEAAEQENDTSAGCAPLWDSVMCWPAAAVGETVTASCPAVLSLFRNLTGTVTRNCSGSGWSSTFPPYYIACPVEDEIPQEWYFSTVKMVYTVGYAASLVALCVAVAILLHFRRLRCARNYIHIQLFLSFILKAVAIFIKDKALFSITEMDHCTLSTTGCKASVVFCHYCVMANFFWLLVEALYLNCLLLWVRLQPGRLLWGFALLGWGVPVIFIVLWIVSRISFEDTECWDINEDSSYWWIIKGPIVVSIVVNFILFVNIIRILVQKLNPRLAQFNSSSHNRAVVSTLAVEKLPETPVLLDGAHRPQPLVCERWEHWENVVRRLTKSMLLLIPLFGTHYIVFNFLPDYLHVGLRLWVELGFGSFQGLIVALLYCFLNKEVQTEVQMMWMRYHDNSYGSVPVGPKGSQMDTPF